MGKENKEVYGLELPGFRPVPVDRIVRVGEESHHLAGCIDAPRLRACGAWKINGCKRLRGRGGADHEERQQCISQQNASFFEEV